MSLLARPAVQLSEKVTGTSTCDDKIIDDHISEDYISDDYISDDNISDDKHTGTGTWFCGRMIWHEGSFPAGREMGQARLQPVTKDSEAGGL